MIGYMKGKPVSQITEILREGRIFTEEEIKAALDNYDKENPVKKKKRGK